MERINQLNTPTKIAILAIFAVLTVFIGAATYLAIIDESAAQKLSNYFTGETETEITTEEKISYTSKTVDDDNLEEGAREIRQTGEDGVKRIIVRVTKDSNGDVINRETVKVETVKEPKDEIIAIGTKRETAQSTPTNGNQSSGNSSSANKGSNNSSSKGTNGGNSGSNNSSSSSSNNNWVVYSSNAIVSSCEKAVIAKYGTGFYLRPTGADMGDSGHYRVVGFIKHSSGYLHIGCSMDSKLDGNQAYFDSNSIRVSDWYPGHIYSEEEIEQVRKYYQ